MAQFRVGVAEDKPVDMQHPDLAGAIYGQAAAVAAAAPYAIRPARADMTDHATMVAWIIAARRSGFDVTGLAPRAFVVPIDGRENMIGGQIGSAASDGVRLFNISAHFGKNHQPDALLDTILHNPKTLFVVAAGNENERVCEESYLVYPACWGDKKNVLVVTATSLEGGSVLTGMNRSAAVHVAAPGQGYYAAGFDHSYVPALGTSFATPIVTAAAARLMAGGTTEPWDIKQRLIATGDPIGNGDDVQGGLLNMARALLGAEKPLSAVLGRPNPDKPEEMNYEYISLSQNPMITFKLKGNAEHPVRLSNLRRVHQVKPGLYRVVYLVSNPQRPQNDRLEVLNEVTFAGDNGDAFKALSDSGDLTTYELGRWTEFIAPAR
jgi:hypothetical protein